MRMLAVALLCGAAALLPASGFAQAPAGPSSSNAEPQQPGERAKDLAVAPQAPPKADVQPSGNEARVAPGGPANICRELVAFLRPKPAPAPPAGAASQPGPNPASSAAGRSVQASGQPAPVPQAPTAPPPPAGALDEATALADANDLTGCQKAVQKMRRGGVAVPAPLLALAALKPELLGAAKP